MPQAADGPVARGDRGRGRAPVRQDGEQRERMWNAQAEGAHPSGCGIGPRFLPRPKAGVSTLKEI
ncbi:hypothetical protein [Microtetraspora glauca]|uniref:Uncharacterized protein n=1 Tax=Microtetraspora glauca TaxID=1996 RepID=A0ABV3GAK4_MICGL